MATFPQLAGIRPGPGGAQVAKNISTPTQIATGYGTVFRVYINATASAGGGVYDMASGGTPSADNLIAVIPTSGLTLKIEAPYYSGLYVDPGTGGNVAVSYGI